MTINVLQPQNLGIWMMILSSSVVDKNKKHLKNRQAESGYVKDYFYQDGGIGVRQKIIKKTDRKPVES